MPQRMRHRLRGHAPAAWVIVMFLTLDDRALSLPLRRFMIVDNKRFTKGVGAADGTLWIASQRPGAVDVRPGTANRTATHCTARARGLWNVLRGRAVCRVTESCGCGAACVCMMRVVEGCDGHFEAGWLLVKL